MRLEHEEKEAQAYECLLCSRQFYWEDQNKPPTCPDCGVSAADSVVPIELVEEEYDRTAK